MNSIFPLKKKKKRSLYLLLNLSANVEVNSTF